MEDTRDHEAETCHQHNSKNNLLDDDEVYDDDEVDDTVRAEEDARQKQRKLKWSLLNRPWLSFLEWLGEHWWGSVSGEQISSFMDTPKICAGDIVIAAHFGDMPGVVCSVTVKTNNAVMTFGVFIRHDSNPIDIIDLVCKLGEGHLLPRQRKIPHNPDYFSVTHIVEEMCYMIKVLKGAWWGASYGSSERLPEHRQSDTASMNEGKTVRRPRCSNALYG